MEIGELLLQRFGHGEGEGHREVVLVGGVDEYWFKDKAECQILACFADPYVALLAYAGGLAAGTNNGKLLDGVDVEEFTVVVGRFERVEPTYVKISIFDFQIGRDYTVIISFSLAA